MLFTEKLTELDAVLAPEIDRLFQLALDNSAHENDLLLWYVNGFYNPEMLIWNENHPENIVNPHCIGAGTEGLSDGTHYEFIHNYRTKSITDISHEEFLQRVKYEEGNIQHNTDRDLIIKEEGFQVQHEMLIYLKIWEADMFIKRFYQLKRILNGESYDWYFKLCNYRGEENCLGVRHHVIRNIIRDGIRSKSEVLANFFSNSYKSQIRNSIAHSNYSIQGRNIHPNNYVENDPANPMENLPFDDWSIMIQHTMVLYNQNIRLRNMVNNHFSAKALENDNSLEVYVTVNDGEDRTFDLSYRERWNDWRFKANLED